MSKYLEGLANEILSKEPKDIDKRNRDIFFMGGYDYKDFFKICFSPLGLKKYKKELIASSPNSFWNTRDFNMFYGWDIFVSETQKEDYVIIKRV